jgi:hypothetical protein
VERVSQMSSRAQPEGTSYIGSRQPVSNIHPSACLRSGGAETLEAIPQHARMHELRNALSSCGATTSNHEVTDSEETVLKPRTHVTKRRVSEPDLSPLPTTYFLVRARGPWILTLCLAPRSVSIRLCRDLWQKRPRARCCIACPAH